MVDCGMPRQLPLIERGRARERERERVKSIFCNFSTKCRMTLIKIKIIRVSFSIMKLH